MSAAPMKSLPLRRYTSTVGRVLQNMLAREAINPFYASYKITNRCNYRCKFCNVWHEKTPILDTADTLRVLDNLERAGTFVLSLEGGEPLLREDIGEVLEHIGRKQYFLLFTTSERTLLERPMREYCRNIDFLHISIDEGHGNLDMFELLPEAVTWGSIVAVQVVVTHDDIPALEDKIARCHAVGAKCVVMPAVKLNRTRDFFPDVEEFARENLRLKQKYPLTIISPDNYFRSLQKAHGCSTGSTIIDTDGSLFYPCRTLEHKPIQPGRHGPAHVASQQGSARVPPRDGRVRTRVRVVPVLRGQRLHLAHAHLQRRRPVRSALLLPLEEGAADALGAARARRRRRPEVVGHDLAVHCRALPRRRLPRGGSGSATGRASLQTASEAAAQRPPFPPSPSLSPRATRKRTSRRASTPFAGRPTPRSCGPC